MTSSSSAGSNYSKRRRRSPILPRRVMKTSVKTLPRAAAALLVVVCFTFLWTFSFGFKQHPLPQTKTTSSSSYCSTLHHRTLLSPPTSLQQEARRLLLPLPSNRRIIGVLAAAAAAEAENDNDENPSPSHQQPGQNNSSYNLGIGKHHPVPFKKKKDRKKEKEGEDEELLRETSRFWNNVPGPAEKKPTAAASHRDTAVAKQQDNKKHVVQKEGAVTTKKLPEPIRKRKMVARDNDSQKLRGALWDEQHYGGSAAALSSAAATNQNNNYNNDNNAPAPPAQFYPDIDLSIPNSIYSDDGSVDLVWDTLRWEAYQEAQKEPLLVSFLYSSILNHPSLESSIAFLLANRLQSPAMMISTQLQSLIFDALQSDTTGFRRSLRADMMAVRDRDPACHCLPDVFLYFKGFHALQSYRVAHTMWNQGKRVLAQYMQSQVSQIFQIDIHPNATLGSGIMLDHGTGIVIGETATVGHNCSILHHVTLGGSGKKGVRRHPAVGNGVLLGAGATLLGPVEVGESSQVGAGTLVIDDLPAHCVAVGVPARIIGSFIDVTEQPSLGMDQVMDNVQYFETDGI